MASIEDVERLVGLDHGLTVVSTVAADGTIQSSVVNSGVLPHPLGGSRVLGLVAIGGSRKLANLRAAYEVAEHRADSVEDGDRFVAALLAMIRGAVGG